MTTIYQRLADKDSFTVVGLYCGAAGDGVDGAVCRFERQDGAFVFKEVLGHTVLEFSDEVWEPLQKWMDTGSGRIGELARLNIRLGHEFELCARRAILDSGIEFSELDLAGISGPIISMLPARPGAKYDLIQGKPAVFEIGEPAVVSEALGLPVVSHFIESDIAIDGNGVVLPVIADRMLFARPGMNVVRIHFGGVTGISFVPEAVDQPPMAFDACAGTIFLDQITRKNTLGEERCDEFGDFAFDGETDWNILNQLHEDPYLQQQPPKIKPRIQLTGRYFEDYFNGGVYHGVRPSSLTNTAGKFIVQAAVDSIKTIIRPHCEGIDMVVISGGGSKNEFLLQTLHEELEGVSIFLSTDLGVPATAVNASSAAALALLYAFDLPGNCPNASGARHEAVLGRMTLPAIQSVERFRQTDREEMEKEVQARWPKPRGPIENRAKLIATAAKAPPIRERRRRTQAVDAGNLPPREITCADPYSPDTDPKKSASASGKLPPGADPFYTPPAVDVPDAVQTAGKSASASGKLPPGADPFYTPPTVDVPDAVETVEESAPVPPVSQPTSASDSPAPTHAQESEEKPEAAENVPTSTGSEKNTAGKTETGDTAAEEDESSRDEDSSLGWLEEI